MRAEEIKGLMEAYSHVYETPEVLSEEVVEEDVEVLDEAPMTAFQAAGGQAKLDQLNKNRSPRAGRVTAAQLERLGQENLFKAGGGNAAIAKGPTRTQNVRGGGSRQVPTLTRQDIINRGSIAASLKQSYEYDAYDLVLEYLLSEGHVETLDEALYVMMEMDSETIQSICKR